MLLLPLLQDAPADTVGYMLLGYAFLLGLPALYLISWFLRRRNLERDLKTIEMLAKEEQAKPAMRAAPIELGQASAAPPPDAAQKPSRP